MIFLLLFTLNVFANDILLDDASPILDDRSIIVSTYYRNEPNFYYFTVAYKERDGRLYRFRTKISFSTVEAACEQDAMITWITRQHRKYKLYGDGNPPEQEHEVCPFINGDPEEE